MNRPLIRLSIRFAAGLLLMACATSVISVGFARGWFGNTVFGAVVMVVVFLGLYVYFFFITMRDMLNLTRESERETAELGIANRIQTGILPTVYPAFPDRTEFDIHALMIPTKQVSGDFYDYFFIDDRHLVMVIADVTGKGIPAALFMVIARTAIKNRSRQGGAPSEILYDVNNHLIEGNAAKMFVSAWIGMLDIFTGVLVSSNAGHECPVMTGEDGRFAVVKDKHGLVMGLRKNIKYTDHETKLKPGETLFLYTDGVIDAENESRERFGVKGLIDTLNRHTGMAPMELSEEVLEEIKRHEKKQDQFDDITMLVLCYAGTGGEGYVETELPADVESLHSAVDFVNAELERVRCPGRMTRKIDLALEELFVNIANYAYPDKEGKVVVRIGFPKPFVAQVELLDCGIPYDPLSREDPDVSLSFKERGAPGGLGIFMSKQIMDELEYEYADGRNHMTMRKRYANV